MSEPTIDEQIAWMTVHVPTENTEPSRPMCKAILASLRRLPLLEAVAEAARLSPCGHSVAYPDNPGTCRVCDALAALDAAKEKP